MRQFLLSPLLWAMAVVIMLLATIFSYDYGTPAVTYISVLFFLISLVGMGITWIMRQPDKELTNFEYVSYRLSLMGHSKKFIHYEIEWMKNNPGKTNQLHDDTCAIITSEEYLSQYGSWQFSIK